LTCCSIGRATVSTSVFALAPGYVVVTCTVGGVIGGYSETGRTPTATRPSRIVTNAMTFARTGRSMKNLANSVVGAGGYRRAALGVAYALRPASGGRLVPALRIAP
jgi:hypothetical protein